MVEPRLTLYLKKLTPSPTSSYGAQEDVPDFSKARFSKFFFDLNGLWRFSFSKITTRGLLLAVATRCLLTSFKAFPPPSAGQWPNGETQSAGQLLQLLLKDRRYLFLASRWLKALRSRFKASRTLKSVKRRPYRL